MAKALEAMLELRGILREGDEENPDVRLCFYGEPRLLVVGDEELREYELALGRLWRADTEVHQTVGRKTLESELLRVLRQTANDSRELQRQDADLMMANLKKSPVQGFFVLRRIEGVAFKGMEPCAAGSCQIIELPRDLQSTPSTTDYILREDMRKLDGVFVQYEVAAREPQRATDSLMRFSESWRGFCGLPQVFGTRALRSGSLTKLANGAERRLPLGGRALLVRNTSRALTYTTSGLMR